MVSILLISNCYNPFSTCLGTVPITIGITVTFMFHSVFSSLARSKYLSIILLSFIFSLQSAGTAKSIKWQVPFFSLFVFSMITWSSLLVGIKRSICISKSQRMFLVSFCKTDSGLFIYHLVIWSKFNYYHYYSRFSYQFDMWSFLESEWQQVFSGLQNFSNYFSRSQ